LSKFSGVLVRLSGFTSPSRFLSFTVMLLIGLLIVTGGRIGIQATPTSEVRWIEAFAELDAWFGWTVIWLAFDDLLFGDKATMFLISKTIGPVVRAVLSNLLGKERLDALTKRLESKKLEDGEA